MNAQTNSTEANAVGNHPAGAAPTAPAPMAPTPSSVAELMRWLEWRRDQHKRKKDAAADLAIKKHHGTKCRVFKEVIDYINSHGISKNT